LRQEYNVAGKIEHERIIRIFAYGGQGTNPYLAMEWSAAPNLKAWVRKGVEKFQYLMPQIIRQMAEGVSYLNSQGWVHRDIKPDNFLMGQSGWVKLIDFALAVRARKGIAKLLSPKSKIQGTRSYMAPEQIRGEAVDERADLYSLGCAIFELLSGKPPFTGASADELLRKHLGTPPPLVSTANRNVTPEFSELLRQTMAKDPAKRLESVGEFLANFGTLRLFKRPPEPPAEGGAAES